MSNRIDHFSPTVSTEKMVRQLENLMATKNLSEYDASFLEMCKQLREVNRLSFLSGSSLACLDLLYRKHFG